MTSGTHLCTFLLGTGYTLRWEYHRYIIQTITMFFTIVAAIERIKLHFCSTIIYRFTLLTLAIMELQRCYSVHVAVEMKERWWSGENTYNIYCHHQWCKWHLVSTKKHLKSTTFSLEKGNELHWEERLILRAWDNFHPTLMSTTTLSKLWWISGFMPPPH